MKTLTLDLGTKTGYSIWDGTTLIKSGTFVTATPKELKLAKLEALDRRKDLRIPRVYFFVGDIVQIHVIERIVFEDVQFASTQLQAQLWSSLRTASWLAGVNCEFQCVPVGTLKKFATGKGNAEKEDMLAFLPKSINSNGMDDNEIDALWLGLFNAAVLEGKESYTGVWERKEEAKKLKKAKKLKP